MLTLCGLVVVLSASGPQVIVEPFLPGLDWALVLLILQQTRLFELAFLHNLDLPLFLLSLLLSLLLQLLLDSLLPHDVLLIQLLRPSIGNPLLALLLPPHGLILLLLVLLIQLPPHFPEQVVLRPLLLHALLLRPVVVLHVAIFALGVDLQHLAFEYVVHELFVIMKRVGCIWEYQESRVELSGVCGFGRDSLE